MNLIEEYNIYFEILNKICKILSEATHIINIKK